MISMLVTRQTSLQVDLCLLFRAQASYHPVSHQLDRLASYCRAPTPRFDTPISWVALSHTSGTSRLS